MEARANEFDASFVNVELQSPSLIHMVRICLRFRNYDAVLATQRSCGANLTNSRFRILPNFPCDAVLAKGRTTNKTRLVKDVTVVIETWE